MMIATKMSAGKTAMKGVLLKWCVSWIDYHAHPATQKVRVPARNYAHQRENNANAITKPQQCLAFNWLVDSGATMHILPLDLYTSLGERAGHLKPVQASVRVANGEVVPVVGETTVTCLTREGRELSITAWVIEKAPFALLSIRRLTRAGFSTSLHKMGGEVESEYGKINFKVCSRTGMCFLQSLLPNLAFAATPEMLQKELRRLRLEIR